MISLGFTALSHANDEEIESIEIVGEYLSSSKANAVKTPTPIIDVPQSLSIIDAEEILYRGITSLGQLIDYTPGVNTSQGEGHRDSFVFRGTRSTADFFIDGNRDDVQYYRSLYNVEQIEILRGPNALLFGRGGSGGVLNRVSKKASVGENFTNYKVFTDDFGEHGIQVDANLVKSESSAIRVNAMYESLENHRANYDGNRLGINPTAHYLLDDNTVLDLSYEYVNHERFIDRGIPTGDDGLPVESLSNVVFADPQNNYHEVEAHVIKANLEHEFSDSLKGTLNVFYGDYKKLYVNFYASDYDDASNIVTLDGYIDETERQNFIVAGNLISEFEFVGMAHTVMVGTELIETNSNQYRLNPVFDSNLDDTETFFAVQNLSFNNLSGTNSDGVEVTASFSDLNDDTRVDLNVYSLYIQDEIELNNYLNVVLGGRVDSFDINVFNAHPDVLETRTRKDTEFSPRAGLIFKPRKNISLYYSYSETFLPKSGEQFADINGDDDRLSPDTFENQEIGIKWDINGNLSLSAAVFENQQNSPQVSDSDSSTFDVIESTIDGYELQFFGQVTDALSLKLNYSHLEGETSSGNTPRELPENTYSAWLSYQVSGNFGIGFGSVYQDESFINNGNTAILPSYTRYDAALYYQFDDDLRVQLNLENLSDESYFPNAHSTHQVTVGAPRNASLSIVGNF